MDLPIDIIGEILTRLDEKEDIDNCALVCKDWHRAKLDTLGIKQWVKYLRQPFIFISGPRLITMRCPVEIMIPYTSGNIINGIVTLNIRSDPPVTLKDYWFKGTFRRRTFVPFKNLKDAVKFCSAYRCDYCRGSNSGDIFLKHMNANNINLNENVNGCGDVFIAMRQESIRLGFSFGPIESDTSKLERYNNAITSYWDELHEKIVQHFENISETNDKLPELFKRIHKDYSDYMGRGNWDDRYKVVSIDLVGFRQ